MNRLDRFLRPGAYLLIFAVAYAFAARLGLSLRFQNSQIGVVWPPNALWVSALLLTTRSRWWIVMTAAALAHAAAVGGSIPVWRLLWQIAGNAAFAAATAGVLLRFGDPPLHFGTRRQVLLLFAAALLMPAVFAFTTPAFVRSLLNLERAAGAGETLLRTTLSNGTAMLIVVPVVLLWVPSGLRELMRMPERRLAEAAVVMTVLLALSAVAFGAGPEVARLPTLLLWIFPPLLWAAVRFGPIGASTSLLCVSALSLWGAARQLGPFVLSGNVDTVLALQVFWIVLCPPVMLLAATIRERERLEALLHDQRSQLAHVTRLTTVGEIAGTLAHELSQPLTSIKTNALAGVHLLDRPQVDRHELRAILGDIVQQDDQLAGVIDRLRLFLRGDAPRFEAVPIEPIVRDALAVARSMLHTSNVDVQVQAAALLPAVLGDRVQILQVVLNLVVNACEAMSDTPASHRRLYVRLERPSAACVDVLVTDSGNGLPDGGADRVFEPFYTTKRDGLGLGLAISRSIASAHGGELWADSDPRGGTTFHLRLPAEL